MSLCHSRSARLTVVTVSVFAQVDCVASNAIASSTWLHQERGDTGHARQS